jgi:predicted Zn-dependent protease
LGQLALFNLGYTQPISAVPSTDSQKIPYSGPKNINLPNLGTSGSSDLDIKQSLRSLGQRAWVEIQKSPLWLDDPLLQSLLGDLVKDLAQFSDPSVDIRGVGILIDPTFNAFAMPGGFVVIHTGLLQQVQSLDELASVLGHEISHLSQSHVDRLWEKQSQNQWILLGALLFAIASQNAQTANATITSAVALQAQQQVRHSQQAETEADELGFDLLTKAGFRASAAASVMERLAKDQTEADWMRYTSTHPLSSERVRLLRNRVLSFNTTPHAIVKNQFESKWTDVGWSAIQSYLKLILNHSQNNSRAVNCQNFTKNNWFTQLQQADCWQTQDQSQKAAQLLEPLYTRTPNLIFGKPLLNTWLSLGYFDKALEQTLPIIQSEEQFGTRPTQAQAWFLRANVLQAQPNQTDELKLEQIFALAKYAGARLDCGGLSDQIKLGQNLIKQLASALPNRLSWVSRFNQLELSQRQLECGKEERK